MSQAYIPTREQLLFNLYEAAELEHNLMCTYLYAAFSLRAGEAEGLRPKEAEAVARWRKTIVQIAVEEMGHLTAVWNISSALGGTPRFGRANFPLDPGYLPADIVVKLAPFGEPVLQHFVYLERPENSTELDGHGFAPELLFSRQGGTQRRLTPMTTDYKTVGEFYAQLGACLITFAQHHGEDLAFCGDSGAAAVTERGAAVRSQARHLLEDGVGRVHGHSRTGRRRARALRKLTLLALSQHSRRAVGAKSREPGLYARLSGRAQPGAASPVSPRRPRVDRRRDRRQDGRPRQQRLRADVAVTWLRLLGPAARAGKGSGHRFGAGADACLHAVGRTRRAPAGRPFEPRLPRRRFIHRVA